MKICPKCKMTFSDFSEECDFCGVVLEDYHPEKTVSEIEKIYELSQKKTSPHQRIIIKERPKPPKPTPAQDPNEVHCPKCGSTQITAVQRKWTFMAGFATNKVDRFCMNCKHKW